MIDQELQDLSDLDSQNESSDSNEDSQKNNLNNKKSNSVEQNLSGLKVDNKKCILQNQQKGKENEKLNLNGQLRQNKFNKQQLKRRYYLINNKFSIEDNQNKLSQEKQQSKSEQKIQQVQKISGNIFQQNKSLNQFENKQNQSRQSLKPIQVIQEDSDSSIESWCKSDELRQKKQKRDQQKRDYEQKQLQQKLKQISQEQDKEWLENAIKRNIFSQKEKQQDELLERNFKKFDAGPRFDSQGKIIRRSIVGAQFNFIKQKLQENDLQTKQKLLRQKSNKDFDTQSFKQQNLKLGKQIGQGNQEQSFLKKAQEQLDQYQQVVTKEQIEFMMQKIEARLNKKGELDKRLQKYQNYQNEWGQLNQKFSQKLHSNNRISLLISSNDQHRMKLEKSNANQVLNSQKFQIEDVNNAAIVWEAQLRNYENSKNQEKTRRIFHGGDIFFKINTEPDNKLEFINFNSQVILENNHSQYNCNNSLIDKNLNKSKNRKLTPLYNYSLNNSINNSPSIFLKKNSFQYNEHENQQTPFYTQTANSSQHTFSLPDFNEMGQFVLEGKNKYLAEKNSLFIESYSQAQLFKKININIDKPDVFKTQQNNKNENENLKKNQFSSQNNLLQDVKIKTKAF